MGNVIDLVPYLPNSKTAVLEREHAHIIQQRIQRALILSRQLITVWDAPYGSFERGQAETIAKQLKEVLSQRVNPP